MSDKKFEDAKELKAWLTKRGVDEEDEEKEGASQKLFDRGYDQPSTLIQISSVALQRAGLSDCLAQHISKKLKAEQEEPDKEKLYSYMISKLTAEIKAEQEEPDNILGKGVLEKLQASVFFLKDDEGSPIGCGFCISSSTALSAAQNFPNGKEGAKVIAYFGCPHSDKTCNFVLDLIDHVSGFAVLVHDEDETGCDAFLDPIHVSIRPGDECVMVAFQIGLQKDLKDLLGDQLSVGVSPTSIATTHKCHFVCVAPTFAGDSGGAIILRKGGAIGVHIETVNQAQERLRVNSLEDDADNDVEASIDYLTTALSGGALGISVSSIMATYNARKAMQATKRMVN